MRRPERSRDGRAEEARFSLRLNVELWLVIVIMAVSFAAGLLVGNLGGTTRDEPAPAVEVTPADVLPVAPPLTEEELQDELPPGHPPLGGATEAPEPDDGQAGGSGKDGGSGGSAPAEGSESP